MGGRQDRDGWMHVAMGIALKTLPINIIGERERANIVVQLARFFYIFISIRRCLSVPVYKLQYFICDTRGPTRNPGKNTT